MDLNSILVSEFAKITNDDKQTTNEGSTVYGTYRVDGDGAYVQIDGSDTRTPVTTTSEARNGDRVTVLIKNHRAIITGNLTDPSTTVKSVEERIETGVGTIQETIDNLKTQLDNQEITLDDYRKAIAEAKRMATDYIDFTAGTGLVIGSSSISSNVRIYSGGIDIRNGDTILASYTDDAIYLGRDDTNSVINMCGSAGAIQVGNHKIPTTNIYSDSMDISSTNAIDITTGSNKYFRATVPIDGGADYNEFYITDSFASLEVGSNTGGSKIFVSHDSINIDSDVSVTGWIEGTTTGNADINHDHSGDHIYPNYVGTSSNYPTMVHSNNFCVHTSTTTSNAYCGFNTLGYLQEYSGSSKRYKHGFHSLSEDLKDKFRKLYDLEVKSWTYNDDYLSEEDELYQTETYGLIAEDVSEVLPEAVVHDKEGNSNNYRDRHILNAMLVLLQEQKKSIDSLESRLESLEKKEA